MQFKKEKQEPLNIVGISIRTNNTKAAADIGALWQTWFQNGGAAQIKDRISDDTYNLYCEYESDHTGDYTVVLGCPVSSIENISDGQKGIAVAPQNIARYSSTGKVPEVVYSAWENIYGETGYERSYSVDYDLYRETESDPENMTVETVVSIK